MGQLYSLSASPASGHLLKKKGPNLAGPALAFLKPKA
jgi:hypothetical protein